MFFRNECEVVEHSTSSQHKKFETSSKHDNYFSCPACYICFGCSSLLKEHLQHCPKLMDWETSLLPHKSAYEAERLYAILTLTPLPEGNYNGFNNITLFRNLWGQMATRSEGRNMVRVCRREYKTWCLLVFGRWYSYSPPVQPPTLNHTTYRSEMMKNNEYQLILFHLTLLYKVNHTPLTKTVAEEPQVCCQSSYGQPQFKLWQWYAGLWEEEFISGHGSTVEAAGCGVMRNCIIFKENTDI
ncbi:hypothetical protein DL96DRAFT_1628050 [Flagelloscypha sp. PMI_526]|nr:hypothetical protein DL96DRAFT_1628050 [Flagelloscypha sp. PMI_526]